MFELEEHLKEIIAQALNSILVQEARCVLSINGEMSPLKQVLDSFSVFFDSEPNTNQDQVFIVFELSLALLLLDILNIIVLYNGVATAINQVVPLLRQPIIRQKTGADFRDLQGRLQHMVEELAPLGVLVLRKWLQVQLKVVENVLEESDMSVD